MLTVWKKRFFSSKLKLFNTIKIQKKKKSFSKQNKKCKVFFLRVLYVWKSFNDNLADPSLYSSFLLCAISSGWPVFATLLACLAFAPQWRLVVQLVKPLCILVCILHPLTASYPGQRDGLDAIVGPRDGPSHAGYGISVPSQRQAVRYRPLHAAVALWEAFPGLQAVEDTEDCSGDGVESCNAITW